jgi:hypothetical protein
MTDPVDQHYTPRELAQAIVSALVKRGDLQPNDRVLDPCVGLGAFSDAVHSVEFANSLRVVTNDIDSSATADLHHDYLSMPYVGDLFQLIVSNPPYSLAQEFIEKSIGRCDPRGCVAFLLPLQFVSSNKRRKFFEDYPPSSVDVIRPRPSFAADGGTDMREYALFRWIPQDFDGLRGSAGRLGFLDWEKPSRKTKKSEQGDP